MHPAHGALRLRLWNEGWAEAIWRAYRALGEGGADIQERTPHMTRIIDSLTTRLRTYSAYLHTRDEIARMPLDVALDLNIFPGDADRIARRAVYGR